MTLDDRFHAPRAAYTTTIPLTMTDFYRASHSRGKSTKQHFIGTHRSVAPEVTFDRIRPHLSKAGITRVGVVTGLDVVGIPTVMITRPGGRNLSVAQGKGTTLVAAKVSGVMEALEHHHAETIELPLRYATREELLRRAQVLSCAELPSAEFAFSDSAPLLWVSARNALSSRPLWVPYELVHLDFRLPLPAGSGYFAASSTGLASGNDDAEATCHALFEIIERHGTAAFYRLRAEQQSSLRLDLGSVDDPICRNLLASYERAGVQIALWDITGELDVPCFLCDVIDRDRGPWRSLVRARGMGCHNDRTVALARALCEAAQSRLTMIAGSRDDISRRALREARSKEALESAHRQLAGNGERLFTSVPHRRFDCFDDELAWLYDRILALGHDQIAIVDLSKADFPIAVVRVIVPGLAVAPLEGTRGQSPEARQWS
jgi:YcaO-like protein with predicted kinase domain